MGKREQRSEWGWGQGLGKREQVGGKGLRKREQVGAGG